MTTTSKQHWRDALQLESADLVMRLYQKIHSRELSTNRARQIVAAYLQGKEKIGDKAWPLMQACITYLEKAFPQLMMEFIQQKSEEGQSA